jgi:serine/threonine protein kinase
MSEINLRFEEFLNKIGVKFINFLGKGSFGYVYLVSDKKNEKYALKGVESIHFDNREFDAAKKLNKFYINYLFIYKNKSKSHNIIRTFNKINFDNYTYILMEYGNCGSLKKYMEDHKHKGLFSVDMSINIIFQICLSFFCFIVIFFLCSMWTSNYT